MNNPDSLFIIYATHSNLGTVSITPECLALQALNPDPTSVFVEHEGEVKEVTKAMVTMGHNPERV